MVVQRPYFNARGETQLRNMMEKPAELAASLGFKNPAEMNAAQQKFNAGIRKVMTVPKPVTEIGDDDTVDLPM